MKRKILLIGIPLLLVSLVIITGSLFFSNTPSDIKIPFLELPRCDNSEDTGTALESFNAQAVDILHQLLISSNSGYGLEQEFKKHTYLDIEFRYGDKTIQAALIQIFRCINGDHDDFHPVAFYLIDESGKFFKIGSTGGGFHTIRWEKDHWIVITNTYFNHMYQNHHLWSIAKLDGKWILLQDIDLGKITDDNFSVDFNDDKTIRVTETNRIRNLPCPIDERYNRDYILSTVVTIFKPTDNAYNSQQTFSSRIEPRDPDGKYTKFYPVKDWHQLCANIHSYWVAPDEYHHHLVQ